jgi:hypothetical protein
MREFFVFTQMSVIPECSSPRREDGPKTMVQIIRWFLVLAASCKAIREHEAVRGREAAKMQATLVHRCSSISLHFFLIFYPSANTGPPRG